MPSPAEVALVAVPLAAYLYALGIFHGGEHPRVVSGAADLRWLLFGLGGLVAFGPLGRAAVGGLFGPGATAAAWVAWVAGLVLAAGLVARTGRSRLVVYHVEADQARAATRATLADLGGSFAATLHGFEDAAARTSVTIRASDRTRTAVIEAQGDGSGALAAALRIPLQARLRAVARPVSTLSTAFFAGSGVVMLAPVVAFAIGDPRGRRALRAVGRWLGWT